MRLLLINQAYAPDVAATAQHAADLAEHLVRRGHEVHVVASRSIYGRRGARLPAAETLQGVHVHRVSAALFGKRFLPLRLLDFALFFVRATWAALRVPRPDIVIPFTTPPFVVAAGLLVRRLRGARVVHWVMDLYPDVPVACGVLSERSLATRALERLHRALLRRCDRIVVLGRCMRDRVLAKGVPAERISLIRPWADAEEVRPIPPAEVALRREWGLDGCVVLYSGNLGLGHDVSTICSAIRRLADEPEPRFVFVGGGRRIDELIASLPAEDLVEARPESDMAAARGEPGRRVQVRPYQPRERLGETLAVGDVHLASLLPEAAGLMVPSKLFGILAAGRPVLFVGPRDSEVARLIEEHDCGRVIGNGDDEGLVAALRELRDDPALRERLGANGRLALEAELSREHACERWSTLLEAAGGSPS